MARVSLQERSHFQKMVIRIGNLLIIRTIVLVLIIVMVSLFRHADMLEDVQIYDRQFTAFKAAHQLFLHLCDIADDDAKQINSQVDTLAAKGFRTLAVARAEGKTTPRMRGLIPLYDPPRDDSGKIINDMQEYAVEVKMVTGDDLAIAREIGAMLWLQQRSLRAAQLTGSANSEILELAEVLSGAICQHLHPDITRKQAQ